MKPPEALTAFGGVVDVGSALLFLALGVFVATVRPRSRVNAAFAVFAIGFGIAWTLSNIRAVPVEASNVATLVLSPLATMGLIIVALEFPMPLAPGQRRGVLLAFAVCCAAFMLSVVWAPRELYEEASRLQSDGLRIVAAALFTLGFGFLLLVLGLRYPLWAGRQPRLQALTVLGTAAFLPYFAAAAGIYGVMRIHGLAGAHSAYGYAAAPGIIMILLATTALWLWNAARVPAGRAGSARAIARNVAWAGTGLAAASAAFAALFGTQQFPNNLGVMGLARGVGVALLAYAILRHQLFGIEVKVRFAIKGSTLAAIFVGVFFVVSEAAQQFFGERSGNEYYGIAAAGALVFAIAPLQRLADRIALKAVPEEVPTQPAAPLEFYRRQVHTAWMDGAMTRREGLILADLRRHLAIPEDEARRIEADAMAQGKALRPR